MANRTDKEAATIHGTNPQNLVEKIVRQKVYQTIFWKEKCFALTAESLLEVAVKLKSVGGTFGGQRKPSDFMCLILKMLQIQPAKEIIIEYIKNEDFKYVRILGRFSGGAGHALALDTVGPTSSRSARQPAPAYPSTWPGAGFLAECSWNVTRSRQHAWQQHGGNKAAWPRMRQ